MSPNDTCHLLTLVTYCHVSPIDICHLLTLVIYWHMSHIDTCHLLPPKRLVNGSHRECVWNVDTTGLLHDWNAIVSESNLYVVGEHCVGLPKTGAHHCSDSRLRRPLLAPLDRPPRPPPPPRALALYHRPPIDQPEAFVRNTHRDVTTRETSTSTPSSRPPFSSVRFHLGPTSFRSLPEARRSARRLQR